MKYPIAIPVIILSLCTINCKKKEDTPVKDCEKNNYGVLKVVFGSSATRHSMVVTYGGSSNSREKITAIGNLSDTMHWAPGTYPVNISSINDNGQALNQQTVNVIISGCNETAISVNF